MINNSLKILMKILIIITPLSLTLNIMRLINFMKKKDTFSLLHTNMCSLQFNGENLQNLLASLEFKFDIVALSETWNPEYKKHTFRPPVIDGYSSYKGTTGSSLKGGCGLYISDELKPLARPDLNVKIKDESCEFETYWTEIIFDKQPL